MESTEFVIVGCGPAGRSAAPEAAPRGVQERVLWGGAAGGGAGRGGIEAVVLERDPVVGAKRVCAAGLRPGFCEEFDLPREIVHLDPATITLSTAHQTYAFAVGPAHTT